MNGRMRQFFRKHGKRAVQFAQQHRRQLRILLVVCVYSGVLAGSLWLSYLLRFDFNIPKSELEKIPVHMSWIVPLQLAVLLGAGHCSGLLSYFSLTDLRRLLCGLAVPSGGLLLLWHANLAGGLPPRSVLLADFILAVAGLSASRVCFRTVRETFRTPKGKPCRQMKRVGIIGAGDAGGGLASELMRKKRLGMQPVAFFDDCEDKWRSHVHNIPVLGPPELLANGDCQVQLDEVAIAMPSAPTRRINEIVKFLQEARLHFTTVPSLDQLATGKISVSHLRPVEIEDLLGRDPVTLDRANIEHYLRGRVVMVTGAGGSIGSELCRQILGFGPARLLLLDQSEVQLFQIEQELMESGFNEAICPLVGDITDGPRMRHIFRTTSPHVIFHAAAHKHVPMMESQPCEAIHNNAFGTVEIARLALEFGVDRFVMISSDKAINPTSVMGATKRLAELFVQSLSDSSRHKTRFMAVRFGNVLGSSGSVIPTFKRQIAAGGPVKVTHPEITRYFMTIPEAVSLVLQSGALGQGGEIFVLDMGKPIKIADLARQLIELSGLTPGEDIQIEYVGLRPGEKLYEELQHQGENIVPTGHPKILRFVSSPLPQEQLTNFFAALRERLYELEPDQAKLLIQALVPEYVPFLQCSGEKKGSAQQNVFPASRALTGARQEPRFVPPIFQPAVSR